MPINVCLEIKKLIFPSPVTVTKLFWRVEVSQIWMLRQLCVKASRLWCPVNQNFFSSHLCICQFTFSSPLSFHPELLVFTAPTVHRRIVINYNKMSQDNLWPRITQGQRKAKCTFWELLVCERDCDEKIYNNNKKLETYCQCSSPD